MPFEGRPGGFPLCAPEKPGERGVLPGASLWPGAAVGLGAATPGPERICREWAGTAAGVSVPRPAAYNAA